MKKKYKFSIKKKEHSGENILSLVTEGISAAAFFFTAFASAFKGGEAESYIGAIGFGAAMLALFAAVLSMKELNQKKNRSKMTFAGAILGGVLFLLWIAVFLLGIKA